MRYEEVNEGQEYLYYPNGETVRVTQVPAVGRYFTESGKDERQVQVEFQPSLLMGYGVNHREMVYPADLMTLKDNVASKTPNWATKLGTGESESPYHLSSPITEWEDGLERVADHCDECHGEEYGRATDGHLVGELRRFVVGPGLGQIQDICYHCFKKLKNEKTSVVKLGATTPEEMGKEVAHFDSWLQNHEETKGLLRLWERKVDYIYQDAPGNGYGWQGIAKESPRTIQKVYGLMLVFIDDNGIDYKVE